MSNLQYHIATLLTLCLLLISAYNISPVKFLKREFIGLIFILSVVSLIASHISQYLITISFTIIVGMFLFYKTKNIFVSLVTSIMPTGFTMISNYITVNLLVLFNINPAEYVKVFSNYVFFVFICMIFTFTTSKMVGFMLNKKFKIIELTILKKQVNLISISILFAAVIFYFNIVYGKDYYSTNRAMLASCILQILQLVFTIYVMFNLINSIKTESEIKHKEDLLSQLQSYTNELEGLYTTMREFRHDYINTLSTMVGYFKEKDMDKLEDYFNKKIIPTGKSMDTNNFKLGSLKNIKIPEIKGIIATKAIFAQEKHIDFSIEANEEIADINIELLDLGRIMGIVLDNAIEAAEVCTNGYIRLAIIKKNDEINIVIVNNYISPIPPIYQLFEKGVSTKGMNRGLGLSNLKKIINQYNNTSIDISTESEEFCLVIKILNNANLE
jgi:two-component system sensor histidine kinase AgrC